MIRVLKRWGMNTRVSTVSLGTFLAWYFYLTICPACLRIMPMCSVSDLSFQPSCRVCDGDIGCDGSAYDMHFSMWFGIDECLFPGFRWRPMFFLFGLLPSDDKVALS